MKPTWIEPILEILPAASTTVSPATFYICWNESLRSKKRINLLINEFNESISNESTGSPWAQLRVFACSAGVKVPMGPELLLRSNAIVMKPVKVLPSIEDNSSWRLSSTAMATWKQIQNPKIGIITWLDEQIPNTFAGIVANGLVDVCASFLWWGNMSPQDFWGAPSGYPQEKATIRIRTIRTNIFHNS